MTKRWMQITALPGSKRGFSRLSSAGERGKRRSDGICLFGDWRSFDGFRHTVEHSVYAIPIIRGKVWGVNC